MKDKVEFRKVREFGEIISDSFLFVKQNFKPLLKSFGCFCGVFIIAGLITSVFTQLQISGLQSDFDNGNYSANVSTWNLLFTWRYIMLILFMILNYTAIYTTVLSYIALYIVKGNAAPNLEEVWSYFKFYFLRIMFGGILTSIIWTVCFVCCIIPGIYVAPAFFIIYSIMVLENTNWADAFSRSYQLPKNNWWVTIATILIVLIITITFTSVIQLPGYLVLMIAAFTHKGNEMMQWYQIIVYVLQYLSQVFFIIPIVASALIHFNLVERKESTGLLARIENFGHSADPQFHSEEEY
jgi:hypothetical protein